MLINAPYRRLLIAASVLQLGACDLSADDVGCDDQLLTRVNTLTSAASKLSAAANGLRDEITASCSGIAIALGRDVPAQGTEVTDDDLAASCAEAKSAIDEVFSGVSVVVEGGRCTVDAEAQFACESQCAVDATCDPGTVISRCEPGQISGICSGSCVGGAVCQGSANVQAQCSGSCGGTCTGTCDGSESTGYCAGRCEGTCSGNCVIAADADINCGASVTCKGGCTVEYEAPRCETHLKPPSCQIDADCEAGCRAQASFQAACIPPTITVNGVETVDQAAVDALVKHMPALVNGAFIQGALLIEAGLEVADAYPPAARAIAGLPQCLLFVADDIVATADASVTAAATINGSVQASVSVSASVGVSAP